MHHQVSVDIDASADQVWAMLVDIGQWPSWNPTVTSLRPLRAGPWGLGSSVEVRQPRLPTATWRVSRYEPRERFEWITTNPGVTTRADHHVDPLDRVLPAASTTKIRPAQDTADDPYLAVHYLYRAIANGSATGCALFSPTAAKQFAANFGAPGCPAATDKLHTRVISAIDYASTGQRSPDVYLGDTMTISSCEIKPEGGPPLGRFILQRTNDKWYITGHETEKC